MPYDMKKGGGTANADTPGSFSSKDTNTISILSTSAFGGTPPDPKKKKKKATTTLKNALASNTNYQIVPGFEERLGGELEGVTVTASATTRVPKKKSYREKHGVTRVGGFIDDIKYGRLLKRPLNWKTLASRKKERKQRKRK